MGKLFKRYDGASHKKCGGKVRGYIAEGADDRFVICIHASGQNFEYLLRLGDLEVARLIQEMENYLRLGAQAK